MDVSSLAATMIGAQAAQAQLGLAIDLMRMDARSADSAAEMIDTASQDATSQAAATQATASQAGSGQGLAAGSTGAFQAPGIGGNLDITV